MSPHETSRSPGSSAADLLLTLSQAAGLRQAPWLPPGEVMCGRLYRHGLDESTGVAWLDETGVDETLVRLAYGISLTGAAPSVVSLGLRVLDDESPSDIFLTNPARGLGRGAPARHAVPADVLVSIAPYTSPGGTLVVLGARPSGLETFELSCSQDGGAWQPFADLRISPAPLVEEVLVLDPSEHAVPGLEPQQGTRAS